MKRYIRSSKYTENDIRRLSENRKLTLAEDSKTPSDVLEMIAFDLLKNPENYLKLDLSFIGCAVARNPNTPVSILELLADAGDKYLLGLSKNPNTPVRILAQIAKLASSRTDRKYEYEGMHVAENPSTPVEILGVLARSKRDPIRGSVAKNPNTPADILSMLADDTSGSVRYHVAENPSTPVDILIELLNDKYTDVRKAASKNPNTPKDLIPKDLILKDTTEPKTPTSKFTKEPKTSKLSWSFFKDQILQDSDSGYDILTAETSAGSKLLDICTEIEDSLGVGLEGSTQLGEGTMVFWSEPDGGRIAEYDYSSFQDAVIDMIDNSTSFSMFKSKYRSFIQDIIDRYA